MTELFLEIRHALRLVRRTPAQAAVIIGSLTLGIGATSAVFSFVNAIQCRLPMKPHWWM
jgi:putative ABC transport system permease protein